MQHGVQFDRPVTEFLSNAAFTLREDVTLDAALALLRSSPPPGENAAAQIVYFYVINAREQLVGILPSRLLILSPGSAKVGDIMIRNIIMLHRKETLFDAMELFAMHRLLAIPVVDDDHHFLGIVEVSLYTDEVFDMAQNRQLNEVFQLVGLHIEQHKQGSPLKGFRLRMPWLISNITGGLICAALGAIFEETVQKVVLIALFIPLILTLAESIAVQSMTLAIEQTTMGGGAKNRLAALIRNEAITALFLGLCSGILVGLVSLFWPGPIAATLTIGGSVAMVMLLAGMLGQTVPRIIHAMKLNPRIASGPITLAVVDIVAISLYLSVATLMLGK